MPRIINLMTRRNSRSRIRSEGQMGRHWRLRKARRKIVVPKNQPTFLQPIIPRPVTDQDCGTIDRAKAANCSIAKRDLELAGAAEARAVAAQAQIIAIEDELTVLHHKHVAKTDTREQFARKANEAGLTNELEPRSRWPMRLLKIAATVFEAVTLAVPMQLLGVVDLGSASHEMIGAALAFLLGLTYAFLLAQLAEGLGKGLKRTHFRHLIETEDARDVEAEGGPKSAGAILGHRVITVTAAALVLAVFATSVIREAAIKILAAAGESQVAVRWPVFAAITLAVFTAVAVCAYWTATPIADEYARLEAPVKALDNQIEAKWRECCGLAAQLEFARVELETIKASSHEDQLIQLLLAGEEIAHRRSANPHIYGTLADPAKVHDVLEWPENHVREIKVPSGSDELIHRINNIRNHVISSVYQRLAMERPKPASGDGHKPWPEDAVRNGSEAA